MMRKEIAAEVAIDHQHGRIVRVRIGEIIVAVYLDDETAVVTESDGQHGLEVHGPWREFAAAVGEGMTITHTGPLVDEKDKRYLQRIAELEEQLETHIQASIVLSDILIKYKAENERLKKWEEWAKSNVKYTLGIKNGMERAYDDCIDIVKRYVAPRMCETVASRLLVKLDCAKQQALKEKAT